MKLMLNMLLTGFLQTYDTGKRLVQTFGLVALPLEKKVMLTHFLKFGQYNPIFKGIDLTNPKV